jgi:hypothetical protein
MLELARSQVSCACFANTVGVTMVMMVLMAEREKWKRTTNIKESFTSRLSKQHKTKWEIYQGLQNEEQTHFFTREEKPEAVAMRSFVQLGTTMKARILAKQKSIYLVDLDVIEQLIGDLFCDVNGTLVQW